MSSQSFPNSFAPHNYYPGRLNVEEDFGPAVIAELHPETGLRHAGADPRREGYALAW